MPAVYITVDTEYCSSLPGEDGPGPRRANFDRAIAGRIKDREAGIFHQMDVLDAHGLKAVFFVDPMPALLWGVAAIEDVVGPIAARGHDVQLHCHTEWLDHAAGERLVGGRRGRDIADFAFEDQCALLDYARTTLMAAGAPAPIAFRAGNYGANDDTLRALAAVGIVYDSSHSPALAGRGACRIGLTANDRAPLYRNGIIELPVASVLDFNGTLRHAQITALSANEMLAAIGRAGDSGTGSFVVVSHSFELLNRERDRINGMLVRRFDRLCAGLAAMEGADTATFAHRAPDPVCASITPETPSHTPFLSGLRMVEQALGNTLYASRTPQRLREAATVALAMIA